MTFQEHQKAKYIKALKRLYKEYSIKAKYNDNDDYEMYKALEAAIKAMEGNDER